MHWAAFYYSQARTQSVGHRTSAIILMLVIGIIVCEMMRQKRKRLILSLVVALIGTYILRVMTVWWGRTLSYRDFSSLDHGKSMSYILLLTLCTVSTIVLTLVLGITSSLDLVDKKNADTHGRKLVIVEFSLVIVFCCVILSDSTLFAFLDTSMGHVSSIPSAFYRIRARPHQKSKLLEDLMCNRIPIGSGKSNTMTRQARSMLLQQWEGAFHRPLTPQAYHAQFGTKRCPLRSKANGRGYPRMPS